MTTKLTHSQLAAIIVVEGALANIADAVEGKMPIPAMRVSTLQRLDMGLPQGGATMFYPLDGDGVFLDLHGAVASVFYANNDYDRAAPAIESAVKQAYPKTKQIKDGLHPQKEKYNFRAYEVDVGNGRLALVEFDIPTAAAKQKRFEARIIAQVRKN